jgi:hypothetical protein
MPGLTIGRRKLSAGTGAAVLLGGLDACVAPFGAGRRTEAPALQLTPVRAGARVTIYAKELSPNVRSSLASRVWTPDDFSANGGKIEIAEFHSPDDFATLREKTLINATGYGARALFGDLSITPVRGQLARSMPQPEVGNGLYYKGVSFLPRRDGLVFQVVGDSDYYGFDDGTAVADRAEADRAVNTIASLFPTST